MSSLTLSKTDGDLGPDVYTSKYSLHRLLMTELLHLYALTHLPEKLFWGNYYLFSANIPFIFLFFYITIF